MSHDIAALQRDFDRDGYVRVPGVLSAGEIAEIHQQVERYVCDVGPTLPREHILYEDKARPDTLKQLPRMHEHDAWFNALIQQGAMRDLAEQLLRARAIPQSLQWFNKIPALGQPTPPHQDGYYFMLTPNDAVTLWLALDPVDEHNGAVQYLPGSHRQGLRHHRRSTVLGFSLCVDLTDDEQAQLVTMPAAPGDLLIHHSLTIHAAGPNRTSDRQRRALQFACYAEHAKQDTAAREAYAKRLRDEMIEQGKI